MKALGFGEGKAIVSVSSTGCGFMFASDTGAVFEQENDDGSGQEIHDDLATRLAEGRLGAVRGLGACVRGCGSAFRHRGCSFEHSDEETRIRGAKWDTVGPFFDKQSSGPSQYLPTIGVRYCPEEDSDLRKTSVCTSSWT
jgi:hypothetical protein